MEIKVYVVNIEKIKSLTFVEDLSEAEFKAEAIRQNNVYSLLDFQNNFNNSEISSTDSYIKFI